MDYDDKDPVHYVKAQKMIDEKLEYKTMNVQQMSKCNQIDDGSDAFITRLDRPLRLDKYVNKPTIRSKSPKFSDYAIKSFLILSLMKRTLLE